MAARKTASGGAKPDKLMRDALILALHRKAAAANGYPTQELALVVDALVDKAKTGDVAAIREIFDRVEGKAPQALQVTGEGGGALVIRWEKSEPTDQEPQ